MDAPTLTSPVRPASAAHVLRSLDITEAGFAQPARSAGTAHVLRNPCLAPAGGATASVIDPADHRMMLPC